MIRTCLKIVSPSPRGVRRSIAKGPVDLLPAERAHMILVRPRREYGLGEGVSQTEYAMVFMLYRLTKLSTPTPTLPHQGGGC
jgi:hypothetical protein